MFRLDEKNKIKYLINTEIESTGLVTHCFSTRIGGVSTGEAATMNFGFKRKDTRENILENFRRLSEVLNFDVNRCVLTNQVHNNIVRAVTNDDAGKGLVRESDIIGVDALVTNERDLPIFSFHADCTPIIFLDPVKKAIGVTHSGWKGTTLNIVQKTVDKLKECYGTAPSDLICAMGPSIGECHFEVDKDVADLFPQEFVKMYEKPHVDLWGVVESQLKNAGVGKIEMSRICTFCNNDLYYSYRGDNHCTGNTVAMIMLKGGIM